MNINNYRSTSITQTNSEVFEKTMYQRLNSFFVKKNMLSSKQIGFRSKRNTTDAIAENTEQFRQGSTDTITSFSFDLRKTFASNNHEILVAKLLIYCVRGFRLKWFESYFKEQR